MCLHAQFFPAVIRVRVNSANDENHVAFRCPEVCTSVSCSLHRITLQHAATHCNTLQHAQNPLIPASFMCCSVLQCFAVYCSVVQCVAMCCNVLQCTAVCCNVLQCAAVCCNVLQRLYAQNMLIRASSRCFPGKGYAYLKSREAEGDVGGELEKKGKAMK